MPFHIKKTSVLGSAVPGSEYYAGDNHWTSDYDSRKIYENEADANAQKETTETKITGNKSYTYQPSWWKNAVVVSE
jgi:hypothetical protein|tara:strand:- start:510 stop:737 length:228 start_codon:yes stop_codon:yes gene_type:complete